MKLRTFCALLAAVLLLPFLFFAGCVLVLPPQYDETYMGELKYKIERLSETDSPRIILLGGSAAAFGVDSALLEENLPGYTVVNCGMYAALGSRPVLDLAGDHLREGDIVLFMPEISEQTLTSYTDGTFAWQGFDGACALLPSLGPDLWPVLLGALPSFATDKLRWYAGGTLPEPGEIYRRSSFNEYGDLDNAETVRNIMPEEYDPDLPVRFDQALPDETFTQYLRKFRQEAGQKGASVYLCACPVNLLSVTTKSAGEASSPEELAMAFYDSFSRQASLPLLGDPRNSLMEAGWFYDTNFHLNRSGRTVLTRQLVRDLKVLLGDSSATDIPIPSIPQTLSFLDAGNQSVLTKERYAGNTQITEIRIDPSVRRIEDRAFSGCTNLQAIYLSSEDPSSTLVGRHLLDGTDAVLYVPAGALSAYRTDYRFSQYAERIYPYTE